MKLRKILGLFLLLSLPASAQQAYVFTNNVNDVPLTTNYYAGVPGSFRLRAIAHLGDGSPAFTAAYTSQWIVAAVTDAYVVARPGGVPVGSSTNCDIQFVGTIPQPGIYYSTITGYPENQDAVTIDIGIITITNAAASGGGGGSTTVNKYTTNFIYSYFTNITALYYPTTTQTFSTLFSGAGTTGLVWSTSADTNLFLRGDGTWASPPGSGGSSTTNLNIGLMTGEVSSAVIGASKIITSNSADWITTDGSPVISATWTNSKWHLAVTGGGGSVIYPSGTNGVAVNYIANTQQLVQVPADCSNAVVELGAAGSVGAAGGASRCYMPVVPSSFLIFQLGQGSVGMTNSSPGVMTTNSGSWPYGGTAFTTNANACVAGAGAATLSINQVTNFVMLAGGAGGCQASFVTQPQGGGLTGGGTAAGTTGGGGTQTGGGGASTTNTNLPLQTAGASLQGGNGSPAGGAFPGHGGGGGKNGGGGSGGATAGNSTAGGGGSGWINTNLVYYGDTFRAGSDSSYPPLSDSTNYPAGKGQKSGSNFVRGGDSWGFVTWIRP